MSLSFGFFCRWRIDHQTVINSQRSPNKVRMCQCRKNNQSWWETCRHYIQLWEYLSETDKFWVFFLLRKTSSAVSMTINNEICSFQSFFFFLEKRQRNKMTHVSCHMQYLFFLLWFIWQVTRLLERLTIMASSVSRKWKQNFWKIEEMKTNTKCWVRRS